MAMAVLIGGSSGALLQANTHTKESLIVAQAGRAIKGIVTDQNGEPLIGCNVTLVGAQGGVITDMDGKFNLAIPTGIKQVKFSYIGYQEQIVNVDDVLS